MKKVLILFLLLCCPSAFLFAAKLDLSSDVKADSKYYKDMINSGSQNALSYYSENADINFTVKKIALEKTDDSSMDVSVGIKASGMGNSTKTVNAIQLYEAVDRYSGYYNNAFINQSYIKIYNFGREGLTASFGRQKYTLGQGLTLSDDDLGFTGMKFELNKFLKTDDWEVFLWRVARGSNLYRIAGLKVDKKTADGTWQFYHFIQNSAENEKEIGWTASNRNKQFTGARYSVSKNHIYFDGEFVTQRGKAKNTAGKNVDYKGYSFLMKGQWNQKTPILGQTQTRLTYAKSSGNSSAVTTEDKAFHPDLAHRFDGLEHAGYGAVYSASSFDTLKTSNTVNGMPDGVSGLNTINIGFDFPYKRLAFSLDYFIYRAAQNINDTGNIRLGSEWDLKVSYPMGERIDLNAVYGSFKPESALNTTGTSFKNIILIALNINAHF